LRQPKTIQKLINQEWFWERVLLSIRRNKFFCF
jgi:hypothetical protein